MAVISSITALTYTEQYGKIVDASETVLVTGVTGTTARGALASAMAAVGVPKCGDAIDASEPSVIVEERVPRFVGRDGSNYVVSIDITYRRQISSATDAIIPRSGGSSLMQIETQRDRDDQIITVEYGDDTIVATITPFEVLDNFKTTTIEKTDDPRGLAAQYKNRVNSAEFMGEPAGSWLCTNVQYELVNEIASPKWYEFTWEFEQRDIGWKYTVAYKDENGNIPEDLTEGVGIKDIDWHDEADFASKFA